MTKRTQLIYIPGLGDRYDHVRRFALRFWVHPEFEAALYPMKWRDDSQSLDEKLVPLIALIKDASINSRVVLVGESAGGAVVVGLHEKYPEYITKTITICGKNAGAGRVGSAIYRKNPAFREAMRRADTAIGRLSFSDRQRMSVFYSAGDKTIKLVDTKIEGAKLLKLPGFGHLSTILLTLFIFKRRIIDEAYE